MKHDDIRDIEKSIKILRSDVRSMNLARMHFINFHHMFTILIKLMTG